MTFIPCGVSVILVFHMIDVRASISSWGSSPSQPRENPEIPTSVPTHLPHVHDVFPVFLSASIPESRLLRSIHAISIQNRPCTESVRACYTTTKDNSRFSSMPFSGPRHDCKTAIRITQGINEAFVYQIRHRGVSVRVCRRIIV